MEYVKLGSTGLDVSRICLGCMSYGDPDRGRPPVDPATRRRAGRSSARRWRPGSTSSTPPTSTPTAPARRSSAGRWRSSRDRDEIVIATKVHGRMRPGPERRGPVPQGDHDRDRRQPAPARHRLRRPLPDPPLGPDDPDRGDPGGAARRGQGRQGPLHRRLLDVRLAVLQGAVPGRAARLDPVRVACRTTTTCSTARRSGRCCRCAPTRASASSRGARWPAAG